MNAFYEKLTLVRDSMRNAKEFPYIREVLDQLLMIAFNNEEQPDTLPKIFSLEKIHYNTNLEPIFLQLNLSIIAHEVYMDWASKKATFQITIVKPSQ